MASKKQQGLNPSQKARLGKLKISPQIKAGMVRHSRAKLRSVVHNNTMIVQLGKGKRVPQAHKIAVKKVGL